MHERALGAPANRARDVREARRPRPARQDELLERSQVGVELTDRFFQAQDLHFAHRVVAGDRKLSAEIEQIVLHLGEVVRHGAREGLGEQHTQRRVELVDRTNGLDARGILGDPRAVAKPGCSGISGAGDNLRQPMPHGV